MSKSIRMALAAALLAALGLVSAAEKAQAVGPHYVNSNNDLFYNYYVGGPVGVPAQMYLSPRPTPPLVGHTYITYQPLMPHEFLYPHCRTYTRYPAGGGCGCHCNCPENVTRVRWW